MIVKGETFSAAWLAAAAVSTNDKEFPKYSNTFKIDAANSTIEAVASELGAWIMVEYNGPASDAASIVVKDEDARLTALMKWVYAKTHGKDAVPIDVHLDVEVDDDAIPGLGGQRLHVSVPRQSYWPNEQTVTLTVLEYEWPDFGELCARLEEKVTSQPEHAMRVLLGATLPAADLRLLSKIHSVDAWEVITPGIYSDDLVTVWRASDVYNIVQRDAHGIAEPQLIEDTAGV